MITTERREIHFSVVAVARNATVISVVQKTLLVSAFVSFVY